MKLEKHCSYSIMYSNKGNEGRRTNGEGRIRISLSLFFVLRPSSFVHRKEGFTFLEILMTLTVIALLFMPIMQLFSNALFFTGENLDRITAMNLAQSEMEKTINLNMTKEQIRKMGVQISPPLDKEPYEINHGKWRVQREAVEDTDPLEIRVKVFRDGQPEKIWITLVTLIEDMMWDQVKTVSAT